MSSADSFEGPHAASRGSLALLAAFGATSLLAYAYAIAMSYLLPVQQYGVVGVMQAILLVGSVAMSAGFPWAIAHKVSQGAGPALDWAYLAGAIVGNALLGLAFGGLVYVGVATHVLGLGRDGDLVAAIVAATVTLMAVMAVLMGTLQGFLHLGSFGLIRTLEAAVRLIAAVVLVEVGLGAPGAVGGFLVGAMVATALAAALVQRLPIRPARRPGRDLLADYSSAGSYLVVMVGLSALAYADPIALKVFSPPSVSSELAGQYQAAVAVSRIPVQLTLAAFTAIFPFAAREFARRSLSHDYPGVGLKFLALFIVPTGVAFSAAPLPIIRLFFSQAYSVSAQPLAVSGVAVILVCAVYAWALLLQAAGRLCVTGATLGGVLVVEIALLAVLIPQLGLIGAPCGLALAAMLGLAVLFPIGLRTWRVNVGVWPTVRYVASIAVLALLLRFCPADAGRVITVVWIVGAGACYLAMLVATRVLCPADLAMLLGGFSPRLAARLTRASREAGPG